MSESNLGRVPGWAAVYEPVVAYSFARPIASTSIRSRELGEQPARTSLRSNDARAPWTAPADRYLESLVHPTGDPDEPDLQTVSAAFSFWRSLRTNPRLDDLLALDPPDRVPVVVQTPDGTQAVRDIRRPVVAAGGAGVIQFSWTVNGRHIEVNFHGASCDLFWMDLATGDAELIEGWQRRDLASAALDLMLSVY